MQARAISHRHPTSADTLATVSTVLVATAADHVHEEVVAALGGQRSFLRVEAGDGVLEAVRREDPDLVVLDLRIGNMGGMAACLDLRLEERAGRLSRQQVLMLLDREADVFLARRAEADAWTVKPLDPMALRRAAAEAAASSPA